MAGTFSQVYVQIVFAVKGSDTEYIAGIIKGKAQKPIIVNGMPDHLHAFIGLKPSMSISDMFHMKSESHFNGQTKLNRSQKCQDLFLSAVRTVRKHGSWITTKRPAPLYAQVLIEKRKRGLK